MMSEAVEDWVSQKFVMGDVNAVWALECAHRRQLLTLGPWMNARCSSETSPSREHRLSETIVVLSILHFSDVRLESASIEVGRFGAPSREIFGGAHLDGVAGIWGSL